MRLKKRYQGKVHLRQFRKTNSFSVDSLVTDEIYMFI